MKVRPSSTTSESAFSLVEVTIAMAIAAVAVVSMLGLLPQGMDTMREASDQAIEGRIHQQLLSEIQMTPYKVGASNNPIDDFNGLEIYYDSQGEELGDSDSGGTTASGDPIKGSFEHIYSARVTLPEVDANGKGEGKAPNSVGGADFDGFSFTGDPSGGSGSGGSQARWNPYIRPVIIEVAPVGGLGADFDWDDDKNRSLIATYQTFIVQMGHDFSAPTSP